MSLNCPTFSFVKSPQNANNKHCYNIIHFSPNFTFNIVLIEVICNEEGYKILDLWINNYDNVEFCRNILPSFQNAGCLLRRTS